VNSEYGELSYEQDEPLALHAQDCRVSHAAIKMAVQFSLGQISSEGEPGENLMLVHQMTSVQQSHPVQAEAS
jgi:hypothetical protein